jgi:hypothetical protein
VFEYNQNPDTGDYALYLLGNHPEVFGTGEPEVCDIDEDGDVDRNDIAAIFAARGSLASGTDDPMDVDEDGIITVGDGRICTLECTNSGCDPSDSLGDVGVVVGESDAPILAAPSGEVAEGEAPTGSSLTIWATGGAVSSANGDAAPVPMFREVAWVLALVLALGGAQLLRRKKRQ